MNTVNELDRHDVWQFSHTVQFFFYQSHSGSHICHAPVAHSYLTNAPHDSTRKCNFVQL